MSDILQIKNVSKSFGKKNVLKDFSLDLKQGKVHGLLGKNGEGKTTLIRMVMGILPPDEGVILYKGKRIRFNSTSYKKEVGYIAEDSIFFGWMKVKDLLSFNASFYPKWNKKRSDDLLKRLSLDKNIRINSLSRGMKLKLGLVIAICAEPELLILDDPTSGLDVPTRHDFIEEIIREIVDTGTTILFSSHQVHEVEGIIDYLSILHNNTLILDDKFRTVKERAKKVELKFKDSRPQDWGIEGILTEKSSNNFFELVVFPWELEKKEKLERLAPSHFEVKSMTLEEMFIAFVAR
jgi:ABC-2 type transport system ATP-binding protein